MKHTIDAKHKKIGRIASAAAHILMGKHQPDYKRNTVADVTVEIVNADQLDISEQKKIDKTYARYSLYPGGFRQATLKRVLEKKGYREVLRRAVYGMLPTNKLRARIIKNLI